MTGRPGRAAVGAGLAGVACLLAACSSSVSPATSTIRRSTTTVPRTTTSRPASTTTSTPHGSTTTTAAGTSRCPTTGLAAAVQGSSGAAGTIQVTLSLTNRTRATCLLGGYPGLLMLDAGGGALPTNVVRGGNEPFTQMTPSVVTIPPGGAVYVNLGYSDVPSGTETTCPTSTSLEITPPNATDHLTIPAALAPCRQGTIDVSPVFSATGSDTQYTVTG